MPAAPPEVQQSTQSGTVLVLGMHSPANMSLYDSSWRHVGFNATTGRIDMEVPKSMMLFSNHDQYIMVFDPTGPYKLLVTGNDTGTYRLEAYYRNNGNSELLYNSSAAIQKGATTEYSIKTVGNEFVVSSALQNQSFLGLDQTTVIVIAVVVVVSIVGSIVFIKRRKAKHNSPQSI
jgi:hypothetical protein